MITLTSVDHVNAPPEKVWHFLTHLHEGGTYLRWHPTDHKAFKLLSGDGKTVGSTFKAVEVLGDKKFSLNYRLNRVEPQKYLEYGAAGLLRPFQLATGSFTLKPFDDNHTELIAKVYIGYALPVIDWLIRVFVNPAVIGKHMDEEGHYLNKTLTTKEG
jgi:hypothetical protein